MNDGWVVYLIECRDGTLYCGSTNDLIGRLEAHSAGRGAKYTRGRTPIALKAWKGGMTRSEALRLECRVKRQPKNKKEDVLRGQG